MHHLLINTMSRGSHNFFYMPPPLLCAGAPENQCSNLEFMQGHNPTAASHPPSLPCLIGSTWQGIVFCLCWCRCNVWCCCVMRGTYYFFHFILDINGLNLMGIRFYFTVHFRKLTGATAKVDNTETVTVSALKCPYSLRSTYHTDISTMCHIMFTSCQLSDFHTTGGGDGGWVTGEKAACDHSSRLCFSVKTPNIF